MRNVSLSANVFLIFRKIEHCFGYNFYVKVNEVNPGPILLCCVVMEISTGWGGFGGGGVRFDHQLTSHC